MYQEKFMQFAFEEAKEGIGRDDGGPFGAVIVKGNEIISRAHNMVIRTNDPTAHAEVSAIRKASEALGTFDLSGTEIYSTCEPCPMCLSAIYWAGIKMVYYSMDRMDAEELGFSDNLIYEDIAKPNALRIVRFEKIDTEAAQELMNSWLDTPDRLSY